MKSATPEKSTATARREYIGMAASPAAHANTILVSDTFGGTSIANPPWTTMTSVGTISENGALDVGLGSPATFAEYSYVKASDGVTSLHSAATTVTYDLQADVNFADLLANASSVKGETYVTLLQLYPSSGNKPMATAQFSYDGFNGQYGVQVSGNIQYGGGSGSSTTNSNLNPATNPNQLWDLNVTYTKNAGTSWTFTNTLTVTSGSNTLAAISTTNTANATNSSFNPITNSNTIQVGDVLYTNNNNSSTGSNYLAGSYTMSNFSDTLIGGSPIPEPATLGLMAAMGVGLLLIGRKRKVA